MSDSKSRSEIEEGFMGESERLAPDLEPHPKKENYLLHSAHA